MLYKQIYIMYLNARGTHIHSQIVTHKIYMVEKHIT